MDKTKNIELVDVVALDLENARLRNENTKLHDIIDRAIIVLAEANLFYLAAKVDNTRKETRNV